MQRWFYLLFAVLLLATPPSQVAASATPSQEGVDSIPVYLFASEEGEIVGIVPMTEQVFVLCALSASSTTGVVNPEEIAQGVECALWDSESGSTTPLTKEGAGIEHAIMQARYQSPGVGRFVSQDPSYLDLGRSDFRQLYNQPLGVFLASPQQLNSYSYVTNNPLTSRDPDGRFAIGFGFNGGGNSPGMYADGSVYAVLTMSLNPFNVEAGIVSSGGSGLTTSVLGAQGTLGLLWSNAQTISDLEGPEAVMGGSVKALGDLGIDVGLSRTKDSRKIITVNPNGGVGISVTPYVVPAEMHGGGGYTKAIATVNVTRAVTNAGKLINTGAQSARSSAQRAVQSVSSSVKSVNWGAAATAVKLYFASGGK